MLRLTDAQIDKKLNFIDQYIGANNAADGSQFDPNSNVTSKNIATLGAELHKDINIQINRKLMHRSITENFSEGLAEEYVRQIEAHEIYKHDETGAACMPYCVSISMYPLLTDGMKFLGAESIAPKHLASFCGSFTNLIFAVSSQFVGAVASVEWLTYFDYFARGDYGDTYLETHKHEIENYFQEVVYTINQPAASRGYQCVREDTTQLSTPQGFKYLHELSVGDDCYVWKDGKIAIEKIQRLNKYDFDGEMLQFKGRNYQQTVTENHRMLYKIPNTNKYKLKEAHELFGHSSLSLPIGSEGIDREDYPISDDLLQLVVAALTDGTIDGLVEGDNYSGRLTIYKSVKRWGHKEIPEILNRKGIGYSVSECEGNDFGTVNAIRLSRVDSQIILRLINHTKRKLPHFFKLLSSRQASVVIDTWAKMDGSGGTGKNKANKKLQCDNDMIRDSLQEVAILAGYGSEIYDRTMKKYQSSEPCIVKYVKLFERSNKRVSEYSKLAYKGNVWCPTTEAGVVIFREENGVPYISGNSCFWNISLYDEHYFNSLFENFVFPDEEFTPPNWEGTKKLQVFFMDWLNKEREKAVLTFPVVTAAMLTEDGKPKDTEFAEMCAEQLSEGNSFFMYLSESADSLASCCRLRSEISDNTFSYTLGAGGVATGSISVMTINFNRLIQNAGSNIEKIDAAIKCQIEKIHDYQIAYRKIVESMLAAGMLPVYDAGFITLDKQFLTIGVNGMLEGAEFLGITAGNNQEYIDFVSGRLRVIYDANKAKKAETGYMFNTEFVPAESLGVKNAKWDRDDGYVVTRDCYNSYFYPVEDLNGVNALDKFVLHGEQMIKYLDGGSALHLNLEEYLDKEAFYKLICVAAKTGTNYFCTNVKITVCEDCDHIDKRTLDSCSKCGSGEISWATRVIGYLKKVDSFSSGRRKEHGLRNYHKQA
jgi:anaerobic ribonucleoside-triphosphate reductase